MHPTSIAASLALKATLVLALAYVASLALRRSSASAHYFVWLCACLAVLSVPLVAVALPR